MFSCVLQVLKENPSNSKIITKSANSLLERFNSISILNLRKEKLTKIRYFLKEFRMSTFLYFNHNFFSRVLDCNDIGGVRKLRQKSTNMSEIYFS
jgi:hypothetical protein